MQKKLATVAATRAHTYWELAIVWDVKQVAASRATAGPLRQRQADANQAVTRADIDLTLNSNKV
tara:strand:+ start:10766 stop:10957 length:192 start_codon:yes stop_codon:yes gene_type:complete